MKLKHLLFFMSTLGFMSCTVTKTVSAVSEGKEITLEDLKNAENVVWYFNSYNSYTIDSTTLNKFDKTFSEQNYSIDVFMGTWCEDSQREVPRFIKIMEYLGFDNYRIIDLDTDKKSRIGFEKDKNLKRVPTFIIYDKQGIELNRIVEYPVLSIEKDFFLIFNRQNYIPNYSE